jgi:hypothetical protein
VPKYDAFGREIGEDTLEGLGGSSTPAPKTDWRASAWPTPEEVQRAEPVAPEAPAESPPASAPPTFTRPSDEAQRKALASQLSGALSQAAAARASAGTPGIGVRKRSAGRGCLVAFVVLLAILGGLTAAIVGVVNSVDVKGGTTGAATDPQSVPETPQAAPPKGLGGGSLVRPATFAAAMREIRTKGGGRLTNLRVAPDRIDATLLTSAGRLRSVQVKPGGKLERFGSDSGPGFDQTTTIPFARIRPGAPQRLARAGAERIGVKVATLQYLVPTNFNGSIMWAAYFTRGRYVLGDALGRFQRKYP